MSDKDEIVNLGAEVARVLQDRTQRPEFGSGLDPSGRARLEVFIEDLHNDRVDLPDLDSPAGVEEWAEQFREDEATAGEPVGLIVIAICATVAYCQKTNPNFLPDTLRAVGDGAKGIGAGMRQILDSKNGEALLGLITRWFRGAPPG